MSQTFRLFVLHKLSPQSHTYIGAIEHVVEAPSITVESLEDVVQDYIRSRQEFKSWSEDEDIGLVVYKVR